MDTNWQDGYFDEDYLKFYEGVIRPEHTQLQVDFLVSIFEKGTKKILDMPCGFGRHSIELAKRGYEVVGVDAYESQLRVAREHSLGLPHVSFIQGDMREMVSPGFDVVINLFSSFGYFSRREDRRVLQNLVESAREDGGLIIIEGRNPVLFLKEMFDNGWYTEYTLEDGTSIETFDPITAVQSISYSRGSITKQATLNVYQPAEYLELFKEFGCSIVNLYGNYRGDAFDPSTSKRLIIVARRGGKVA